MPVLDIDQLRKLWTDRKVRVVSTRPEHQRVAGRTAIVKTVNQNGRALIQLLDSVDITWYDIDPADLRGVEEATL